MIRWIPRLWSVFTTAMYGGTIGQPSFRLLPERPRCRRSRATVKLSLEGLTDRILPSASGLIPTAVGSAISPPAMPQATAVMSQMASAINQWDQVIATVERDLLSAWNSLIQEIGQEVSSVQQQLGFFLGINLNNSNQSLGTTVTHVGSGLGIDNAVSHPRRGLGIHSGALIASHGPEVLIAIAITSPSEGGTDSNPITVSGTVNPSSCTITCTITSGGTDYDGTVEGPDEDGNWYATFPTIPSGAATITATATLDGQSAGTSENITVK